MEKNNLSIFPSMPYISTDEDAPAPLLGHLGEAFTPGRLDLLVQPFQQNDYSNTTLDTVKGDLVTLNSGVIVKRKQQRKSLENKRAPRRLKQRSAPAQPKPEPSLLVALYGYEPGGNRKPTRPDKVFTPPAREAISLPVKPKMDAQKMWSLMGGFETPTRESSESPCEGKRPSPPRMTILVKPESMNLGKRRRTPKKVAKTPSFSPIKSEKKRKQKFNAEVDFENGAPTKKKKGNSAARHLELTDFTILEQSALKNLNFINSPQLKLRSLQPPTENLPAPAPQQPQQPILQNWLDGIHGSQINESGYMTNPGCSQNDSKSIISNMCEVCGSMEAIQGNWYCQVCLARYERNERARKNGYPTAQCAHSGQRASTCDGCQMKKFVALSRFHDPTSTPPLLRIISGKFQRRFHYGPSTRMTSQDSTQD